jgi:hypothetical protein
MKVKAHRLQLSASTEDEALVERQARRCGAFYGNQSS